MNILRLQALAWLGAAAAVAAEPAPRELHGQPSYVVASPQVEVAVTRLGGQMAPVTFYRDTDRPVQPYYVSPWQAEPAAEMPAPVLVPLRGDFFCLPFGGNAETVAGEKHPPHGEVAGSAWQAVSVERRGNRSTLTLAIETRARAGRVTKEVSLVDGQNVVYTRHVVEGFTGRAPVGHHAILALPEEEGTVRIATSPLRFGMTAPGVFSDPRQREYQALLPGAEWTDPTKVPALRRDAPEADLTRLPGRYGHCDLVQLVNAPATDGNPAWVAATFPDAGYVWFALKDPTVLASTVLWMEYHGRHGHPWNGRNNCLGIEDVTACFAAGLATSLAADNPLAAKGVATALEFVAGKPTVVSYVQGVVRTPAGFDRVAGAEFAPGRVTFVSAAGPRAEAAVAHSFVRDGRLPE